MDNNNKIKTIYYEFVGIWLDFNTLLRQGNGGIFALSREAEEADAKALALATRDVVRQMMNREHLQNIVDSLRVAHERKIAGHPEKTVKMLGGVYRLAQDEQTGILRHLIDGGDLSQYGLINALTRTAQDSDSYDRAVELEELGGTLLEMPVRQLQPILMARAA